MRHVLAVLCLGAWATVAAAAPAPAAAPPSRVVPVAGVGPLRQALADARPGDVIRLAPGQYGSLSFEGLHGSVEAPVTLESAEAQNPAVFGQGTSGLHLVAPRYVTLRNLVIRQVKTNGLNIDDGGKRDGQSRGIRIENLRVEDIGPTGNNDGIKLSGLDDFRVTGCTVTGWGGSGIDLVGCHDGLIEGGTFRGKEGFSQSNAVQIKGGCRNVTVRGCLMVHPGFRGVNLGGSTGRPFFRPPLETLGAEAYEASRCVVEGCRFIGGDAAVAFVSQSDCVARYNTVYRPAGFAFRILQESVGEPFVPSRRGTIEYNVIVWRSDQMRAAVNVGPNTDPKSFVFRANLWHCEDDPSRSRPELPVEESNGVYKIDPKLKQPGQEDLAVTEPRAAKRVGAEALPRPAEPKEPRK
jgi:hypothetical protein